MCKDYHLIREKIKDFFRCTSSAFALFSGGLDSMLLVQVIHEILGDGLTTITFTSPLQKSRYIDFVKDFNKSNGINHLIIDYRPLSEEGISANSMERCYYCKRLMFSITRRLVESGGGKAIIVDGSHVDDDPALRPGMRANIEFGIVSPWRAMGLNKKDIRGVARDAGLVHWNVPRDSCLATRFPFGYALKYEDLIMVELVEETLMDLGFKSFRLRPSDSPPVLCLSNEDFKNALNFGKERLWDMISFKTGLKMDDFTLSISPAL